MKSYTASFKVKKNGCQTCNMSETLITAIMIQSVFAYLYINLAENVQTGHSEVITIHTLNHLKRLEFSIQQFDQSIIRELIYIQNS